MKKSMIVACLVILSLCLSAKVSAQTQSSVTELKVTMQSGALSTTSDPLINFSPLTQSGASQNTSATVALSVIDERGSGAGWTVNMNMDHLTTFGAPVPGGTNTSPLIAVSSGYRYDGRYGESPGNNCTFTITINTPGPVGTATFLASISGGINCVEPAINPLVPILTAPTNVDLGGGSLLVNFPAGNYVAGDTYQIPVDMVDYHQCIASPQTPTAVSGSLIGVTAGTAGALTGVGIVSNAKQVLEAEVNKGMGAYSQNINLSCTVHANPLIGLYKGTVVFTVI